MQKEGFLAGFGGIVTSVIQILETELSQKNFRAGVVVVSPMQQG